MCALPFLLFFPVLVAFGDESIFLGVFFCTPSDSDLEDFEGSGTEGAESRAPSSEKITAASRIQQMDLQIGKKWVHFQDIFSPELFQKEGAWSCSDRWEAVKNVLPFFLYDICNNPFWQRSYMKVDGFFCVC